VPDAATAIEGIIPGAVNASESVEQMAEQLAQQKLRSTLGDFEAMVADTMAKANAAFSEQQGVLQQQIKSLTDQLAAVRVQAGPPSVLLLAKSLAQRVTSISQAHPDLGALHFAGVTSQAASLADAVEAAVNGTGPVSEAERLVNSVGTWFTRTHPRLSSKFLEGMHGAVDEAERIAEGLAELAPVAAAVAKVL
jgi:hypothetical protein